jgi:hypothetical protein
LSAAPRLCSSTGPDLQSALQVHFRTYPSDLLIPIEGEETIKWSYMNALKEVRDAPVVKDFTNERFGF